ncbi:hypothetical protein ACFXO9_18520 [Nocardia tengchongensis]|uniref:hypothetical protein n=1 Tax=Nocardia tengchongensis TaxID=2055889 RepID=UPI0036C2642D
MDTAWTQLSPSHQTQSGGKSGYTTFWSKIRSVRVDSITSTDYRTGTAGLTYVYTTAKLKPKNAGYESNT